MSKEKLGAAGQYLFVLAGLIALSMILKPWLVITVAAWDLGKDFARKVKK